MRIALTIRTIVKLLPFIATAACAPMMQSIVTTSNQPGHGTTGVGGRYNPQGIPVRLSPAPTPVVLPNDVLASRGVHLDSAIPAVPDLPPKVATAALGTANAAIVAACTLSEILPLFSEPRVHNGPECDMNEYKRLHPAVFTVPKTPILVH